MRLLLALFLGLCGTHTLAGSPDWSERELRILKSLSLSALAPIPGSPSNRVADDPQAAAFGRQLFFDPRFSRNGQLSCASCHQPDKHFTDQRKVGIGIGQTMRNTPTVVGSGWLHWFYWDGRRDSLWSQALIPFESPDEMGSSRTHVIREISRDADLRRQYETLYGALPLELTVEPRHLHASPMGDRASRDRWYRLPDDKKHKINRVFSNIGKAIAAYERTLIPTATRFDRYVEQLSGVEDHDIVLTAQERSGIELFIDPAKTQCMQCHNGALLANGGFHNVGSGSFYEGTLDFGRSLGLQAAIIDEFNCLGNYSDASKVDCHQLRFADTSHPQDGAFKTPSLRNLGMTAPYFHDGRFDTLSDVMHYYNQPPTNNGPHELRPLQLNDEQLAAIVAFLDMLNEE
ncbi:MAG: c-type cytochrome [Gammaproteobacteria bacterium]|nr:c-type cytochrome [Gammaproteobacteria bacterium]